MNITDNLIRIKEGKDNIIKSLKNKGVSIADNTLINEIPTIIDNAEIGGGGGSDTPVQPETPELVQKYEGATVFRINVPEDNYEFAINLCNDASTATYDVVRQSLNHFPNYHHPNPHHKLLYLHYYIN